MHSELKREEGRRCNVTRSRQMNALAATILKTGRGGEKNQHLEVRVKVSILKKSPSNHLTVITRKADKG